MHLPLFSHSYLDTESKKMEDDFQMKRQWVSWDQFGICWEGSSGGNTRLNFQPWIDDSWDVHQVGEVPLLIQRKLSKANLSMCSSFWSGWRRQKGLDTKDQRDFFFLPDQRRSRISVTRFCTIFEIPEIINKSGHSVVPSCSVCQMTYFPTSHQSNFFVNRNGSCNPLDVFLVNSNHYVDVPKWTLW